MSLLADINDFDRNVQAYMTSSTAYQDAGVDIEAGNRFADRLKSLARSTDRPGVAGGLGGFGGLFDPAAAGFSDPLLVAATDGVGTKVKVAIESGRHDGLGVDLVAMCVNDLIVQGAQPLFFLDYFATGALEENTGTQVVSGIAEGCRQSRCALIGGETAEMPGLYQAGDYDLAGFAVGAVERDQLVTGETIRDGDLILGLAANGFHANGYSLIRKIVDEAGLAYDSPSPVASASTLGETLLTPTRIYVRAIMEAVQTGKVRGLAHITGGGLLDNLPRVLPDGLGAELDASAWTLPEPFGWLKRTGNLTNDDLAQVFNCGIGMAVICRPRDGETLRAVLEAAGETVRTIGVVSDAADADNRVRIAHTDTAWAVS